MKNYREILVQLTVRILVATPFFVLGWYLIASAKEVRGSILQLLLAMASFVACAVIVAPLIARLFAEPTGSLYYPNMTSNQSEPGYSKPESLRKKGLYEEAISEYEKIAKEFPEEVKPYIEMIDIAVVNLEDHERADTIYKRGLSVLKNDEDRDLLRIMRKTVTPGLSRQQLHTDKMSKS